MGCSSCSCSPCPPALAADTTPSRQAEARGGLRTRSLHAEVVFGLSGSRHVRGWGGGGT